jgi:hypothetical protein
VDNIFGPTGATEGFLLFGKVHENQEDRRLVDWLFRHCCFVAAVRGNDRGAAALLIDWWSWGRDDEKVDVD